MQVHWESFPATVAAADWPTDDVYVGPLSVSVVIEGFELQRSDELVETTQRAAETATTDMGWTIDAADQWGVDWTVVCETPIGIMIRVDDAFDPPTLRAWVENVARHLSDAGVVGEIRGMSGWAQLRENHGPGPFWPGLATLYYELGRDSLDERGRPYLSTGPLDAEHVLQTQLQWLDAQGRLLRVDPQYGTGAVDCAAELAARYLAHQVTAWNTRIHHVHVTADPTHPSRDLWSGPNGQVRFDSRPAVDDWTHRVEEAVALLRREASNLDLAIAPTANSSFGGRHLLRQYLERPSGVMVLQSAHLDKASRLDDWVVELADAGRWLVRSRHLDAWFSGEGPDAGAVESAGQDFRDAIITLELMGAQDLPYLE